MKIISKILIIIIFTTTVFSRELGETEITTEDGIEVYQNEKFYLLKKNVKISSDSFTLSADKVKVEFDKNLYDIINLNSEGNVSFDSDELNIKGNGKLIKFNVSSEELKVEGLGSQLISEDITMISDGYIKVNNSNGNFLLKGPKSKLTRDNIIIEAEYINGNYSNNSNQRQITFLEVSDKTISYLKNNDVEMYAKRINFDDKSSIIELMDSVSIIRDGEKISGDYGTLDTKNNSYKIKSKDKTKVKAVIKSNEQ